MADGFDSNKTEAPTPRRREKAREDGQVVYSADLNSSVALMMLAIAAVWMVPLLTSQLQQALRDRILTIDGTHWGVTASVMATRWLMHNLWLMAGGFAICFLGLNMLLAQVQSGFAITFKPLNPKWDRLDPVQGMQRLWSLDSLMRGVLALIKVTTLSVVALALAWSWRHQLWFDASIGLSAGVSLGWRFLSQLMLCLAGTALVWGITDYGFRWFRNEQKLKMSREEIKDEMKEEQGDPQLKGRIRRMQKEAAQRRTLQDVPQASVVLTNPTHFAVALRYESGQMRAPIVLAKGSNAFARQIAAKARQHGIPVLERKPLARALYAMAEVGKEIPLELYGAVAEILAFLYRHKR